MLYQSRNASHLGGAWLWRLSTMKLTASKQNIAMLRGYRIEGNVTPGRKTSLDREINREDSPHAPSTLLLQGLTRKLRLSILT